MYKLRWIFIFVLATLSEIRAVLDGNETGEVVYVNVFVFLGLLAKLCNSKISSQDNVTEEVVFVNVLFRHGARTPAEFYPKDPYQNISYWPEGVGQLTNEGKRQAFDLGRWLRQRYDTLLTDRYSPDIVYVQSTDKDRTLMSAQCNLAGMFPPKGAEVWSQDLAWQPVPVHTTPMYLDKILAQPPRAPCSAYTQELHKVFSTDDKIRELNQTYSELLRWTSENSGKNYTLLSLYSVYDALLVESMKNLTLPDWTRKVFPNPMQEANVINYKLETWTPTLTRLVTGLLLQNMTQNMLDKVGNRTTRNMHVYSAHDETIVNLLNAIGAFNNILPPYAACVMVELRVKNGSDYYVSVYYRNSTTDGPYLLSVAGCAPLCPLDTFLNITKPLIPDNWDAECFTGLDYSSIFLIVSIAVAAGVAVILIRITLCYCCCRRRTSI